MPSELLCHRNRQLALRRRPGDHDARGGGDDERRDLGHQAVADGEERVGRRGLARAPCRV